MKQTNHPARQLVLGIFALDKFLFMCYTRGRLTKWRERMDLKNFYEQQWRRDNANWYYKKQRSKYGALILLASIIVGIIMLCQ